jgi:branched-chain amino acid transport system ATP-binding protein
MLRIEQINVFYGDVQVLWDVSLRVSEREIVTVVGPNGAGKSTLLMTIVNIIHPKKDNHSKRGIFLKEAKIDHHSPEDAINMGIAIVPEGARVFPEMSVLDNLRMGSYIRKAREVREQTLEEVYALFPRLRERQSQKGKTLSGGERQMLALGRALMSKPDLLLLDEPSLGLQPMLVTRTFEAIREINRKGMTILLVEQNVNYSLEISDRAYVLENGRIVLEGSGKDLLNDQHVKKAYLAM